MNKLNLSEINKIPLRDDQYYQQSFNKSQIYLHHTAGGPDPINVISGWNNTPERIGTCVVIAGHINDENVKSGDIFQCFSSKFWSYHLGVKSQVFDKYKVPYKNLEKTSIGIELCSWGGLTERGGKYYNYVNREIPKEEVCILDKPFRGYIFYQKYTDEQIISVEKLLCYWKDVYSIDIKYKGDRIFDICKDALQCNPGVYTHCSVRIDKNDIFPQPELIQMLKSL